jgi:Flp pilus assembly protein TadG
MNARVRRTIASLHRQESGSVLVEFVVLLPFLLALLLGIVEVGRGLFYHHFITNGVRDGLRYLSRAPLTADEIERAKQIVLMGLPPDYAAAATVTVPAAWTPPNAADFRTPPQIIWIRAEVPIPFPLLTFLGLDPEITFTITDRMRHVGE